MYIENYQYNKSSFLTVEKDLSIIMDKLTSNERLKKLLYYPTRDALKRPSLNDEQFQELLNKNIKIVPKIYVDSETLTYINILFDNFELIVQIQNLEIMLLVLILFAIMTLGYWMIFY